MRARSSVCLAVLLGLLLLPCASCSDDDNGSNTPTGANLVAGYASVPPGLEGSWVIQSVIGPSTCGFLREFFPTERLELRITQVGNDLAFDLRDGCGRRLPSGKGTVTPTGIVTLSSTGFEGLTSSCTLRLAETRTGTAATPPNSIAGSDVLHITGGPDCAAGVPCTVNGTFSATRCPESGCGLTCQ